MTSPNLMKLLRTPSLPRSRRTAALNRRSIVAAASVAIMLAPAANDAHAQTRSPSPTPPALGDPVIDETYGFSIRPPADWLIERRRLPDERGITLLRMIRPRTGAAMDEMVLKQTATTRDVNMEEMLEAVADNWKLKIHDAQILSQQVQSVADRPGGILAATMLRDGQRRFRMQAIVESRPRTYFVLIYEGSGAGRSDAEVLFHLVLNSLSIVSNEADQLRLKKAFALGEELLGAITPARLESAVIPEQNFRIEVEGKPIGFVAIYETARHDGEGQGASGHLDVVIRERGWTFNADGRIRRLQSDMSVSFDRRREKWRTSVTTCVPAKDKLPEYLEVALEEGLRVDDMLVSNQSYQLGVPAEENPPLQLPPTYASRVVTRLLPRLVADIAQPQIYAVASFDHARAGLVARVIELKGPAAHPDGSGECFRVEDREGMAAQPTVLFVDDRGRTQFVEAPGLVMKPADGAELEREFGPRIAEAHGKFAALEARYDDSESRLRTRARPTSAPRP